MDPIASEGSAARFTAYIDGLSIVIGHAGRVGPLQDYARGLLLPVARKSGRADSGGDRAVTNIGAASVAVA
ncbi:MAG: hypothetical protein JOY71_19425, partial [Acetobacteraceae bacterium]|nr:hypothetical protein [Acetobacteraceae bacterium]